MNFTSDSTEKTIRLGECIGSLLTGGEFIKLTGELGGGKTHFTKGIAAGLGITENIVSPTFTIERVYVQDCSGLEFHHFDFYRLGESDEEIFEGIKEITGDKKSIVVVEWPENIGKALPGEFLELNFEYIDENTRKIEILARGEKYEKLLKEINDTCS